jgi:phosphoglycerate dehydrogenase-like enzyme
MVMNDLVMRHLARLLNSIHVKLTFQARIDQPRKRAFPEGAKKVDTFKDLLSSSDIVSLHCALTNDTVQLINSDSLQHIKPGMLHFSIVH